MKAYLHFAALCIALAGHAARADDVDRYTAQQQRVYGLPAVVTGLIRDGRLVDKRAIGLANIELGVPATTEQVFEIGSISKQFHRLRHPHAAGAGQGRSRGTRRPLPC